MHQYSKLDVAGTGCAADERKGEKWFLTVFDAAEEVFRFFKIGDFLNRADLSSEADISYENRLRKSSQDRRLQGWRVAV